MILEDGFSRRFHYLRLSLTEACNFRCTYCLPDGYRPDGRKSFLTVDEIRRVVHGFAELGVKKIRLTGGEPSMRRDLPAIIETVANTTGIEKVAMTTNGYRLKERAAQWYDAGLRDLNVSIDSLDPRQFQLITGENKLAEILDGIEAAQAAGYHRIKVNSVLLKNLNDHELSQFLFWIKGQPIQLRLIELMQTGEMDARFQKHHQSGLPIKMRLLREGWLQQPKGQTDGPAEVFSHPDYLGQIGLIMPYSKDFCASCNRLRVSAVGKLHLCLFGEEGVALRDLLQEDSQHTELQMRILEGLTHKRETHFLHQGNSGVTPHLASIGANMQKITGLVLAGGRSSRMGTNKALLEINGETLLNRAVRLLELSGCKEVFISGDYYGQRSVPDRAQLGPLAGIAAGLDVCKTEKLLILPVDMPYMTSELLQLLMRFTFAGNGISYADAQFPLLLLNNDANREILAGLLAPETPANQRSMHQFCHAALIIELPISPKYQYCFENTNTPEEWQLCQRRLNETNHEGQLL